ncbi:hypothetical protein D3C84_1162060 [compost metagenome]
MHDAQALAEHVLKHMALEEGTVIPLAQEHLSDNDWEQVARAFSENGGPNYGDLSVAEFRQLFSHIANVISKTRR